MGYHPKSFIFRFVTIRNRIIINRIRFKNFSNRFKTFTNRSKTILIHFKKTSIRPKTFTIRRKNISPRFKTGNLTAQSGIRQQGFCKKAVSVINLMVSLYLASTFFNPKNNEFLIRHFTKPQPLGAATAQILSGGTL